MTTLPCVRGLVTAASLGALACVAGAQRLEVGSDAPAIEIETWLNVDPKERPTPERLAGKVVMVEFWGTWCAPCVRAMPNVQRLHDRYSERGLVVLAISYEPPEAMKPFLTKHAYTMPVGSDAKRAVVSAYKIRGWPTTIVIDKQGKVAFVGHPSSAEAAIEKALGLESSPATLLTGYLRALENRGAKRSREELERLMEKASAEFDLKSWAGTQKIPDGLAVPAVARLDAAKELTLLCAAVAKKSAKKRDRAVCRLQTSGSESFDLSSWARGEFGRAFPIKPKEFNGLLAQRKFAAAVDVILTRRPSGSILRKAAKHGELRAYCRKKAPDKQVAAKKGVMVRNWVFGDTKPKDNDAFWKELSVSGMSLSKDKKSVLGVMVGGQLVTRAKVASFIRDELSRAIVMEDIASGKAPSLRKMNKLVERRLERIRRPLEQRYGKPQKR